MPKFEIDLNKLPEEQNLPSSPEHTASKDFTRQQGENSTSRGKQGSIGDLTRHFATNPYYHQAQGESSRQQGSESCVVQRQPQEAHCSAFQPWKPAQPQEAHCSAFQPWKPAQPQEAPHQRDLQGQRRLDGASSSQQADLASAPWLEAPFQTFVGNIQESLQFHVNELWRDLASARPCIPESGGMLQQPDEQTVVSNNHFPSSSLRDIASVSSHHDSQERGRERKRDGASSSLGLTPSVDGLAPQQAQSDQTVHEQQNEKRAAQKSAKRRRDRKGEYQRLKEKAAKLGTTPYEREKARLAEQGTTPHEKRKARLAEQGTTPHERWKARLAEQGTTPHEREKARLAEQGTTPGKIRYEKRKAILAEQGTTPGKIIHERWKARLAEQGTTPYERRKARLAEQGTTPYERRKARLAEQGTTSTI